MDGMGQKTGSDDLVMPFVQIQKNYERNRK